jgi:putative chitinase
MLTLELMQRLWPHGNQHVDGLLEGIVDTAPAVFEKYELKAPLAVAHAMAQFSEECGQGLEMWEDGNYTASRLLAVFPTHFTPAMAARAAHNPRLVFDIAYGGRMGNARPPSDDGYDFRGRSLSQVTGYDGYKALGEKIGEDLISHPDLVCDPQYALESGVADFVLCGCLPFADQDNVLMVTKHLNGGTNGLAERRRQLAIWKRALGV